tara:strand:+ start:359 stop:637 length:279 start_codon:yes stop_codon:yes gene_type:complete
MFRCDICGASAPPRTSCNIVPVKHKKVVFPFRKEANVFKSWQETEKKNDPGGEGVQIAKEIKVCPRKSCANRAKSMYDASIRDPEPAWLPRR